MHDPSRGQSTQTLRRMAMKVPEITLYFWVVKLLTTAMGEATSDWLVTHIDPVVAVVLGAVGFVVSMVLQFRVRRYIAAVYWLVVVMVSIFGTMVADAIHIVLHVPYYISTSVFAIALILVLVYWHKSERTLSVHSIYTTKRETFYWATVLATFALGTAAGDMTAVTLHLGYLSSGIAFSILFVLPGILYWVFGLNEIFAFWFAYIMTRPVGASFADWFGVARHDGGMGFGRGPVALVLTIAIVALVAFLAITKRDVQEARKSALRRTNPS